MIRSGRVASKRPRLAALIVTVATALSLCEGVASAQARTPQPIRDSISTIDYGPVARQRVAEASAQTATSRRRRSVTRRILGGAIGATAGFFAGGYLGAAIEGDRCNCDDPGLKGALIGAPVGAVTGGILGAMFF